MSDSRIEKLLKAILGQEVQLEPRESRVERLLYAILTSGSHDEPTLSEMEDILLCILNGERYDGPTSSRINALLKVKANGGDYDEPRLSRIEELIYEWITGGDISIYTGTLPTTLQTVAGYLKSYKIWGNTGGVGLKTEQLFSTANSEGGHLDTDGNVISPQWQVIRHTDFLPLPLDASDITVAYEGPSGTGLFAPALCFYDGAKTYLTGESYEGARTKTFTVPENARYFRTSYRSTMTSVNIVAGAVPATSDIPYGYKLPILSNDATTDIYIGDTQLAKDEYVDSSSRQIYKRTENLLDETWFNDDTQLSASSGLPVFYTGRIAIRNPINVSNIDTVTLTYSLGTTATEYFMYSIFSGNTLIERMAGKTSGDIIDVTNADTLYICLYIGGRNITVNDVQWIMLNLGSVPLPYEPYLTPTDPPAPLPQIPTTAGETTISYGGAGVQPEKVELKYRK